MAIREGVSVVVSGSVEREGSMYLVSVGTLDAMTGKTIANKTSKADRKDILLQISTLAASEKKPLLVVIAGPMGAGKTTFYDAHLKEAFPTLVPPVPHQREAALSEQRSFAVEDLVVDTGFLENARDAGYTTKVIFISTEDPNLNVGRILIRMSHGGQSVPLAAIPAS